MGFNTFPCNPYPISTEELNKGNNDDLNTRVAALESEVSDLNSTKANQITIAPFFSAEASYSVGDLVYYNGLTYRCTNDHEGEWDADDFAATTISSELDTLKNGLSNYVTKTNFADVFNLDLPANSSAEHALTGLEPFRSYLVMAIGQYNPLWSYIGVLYIVENGDATLVDLRASTNMLTGAIADKKLVFANENLENSQVINVSIIGYNIVG